MAPGNAVSAGKCFSASALPKPAFCIPVFIVQFEASSRIHKAGLVTNPSGIKLSRLFRNLYVPYIHYVLHGWTKGIKEVILLPVLRYSL